MKTKLTLKDLTVTSFTTALENQAERARGGYTGISCLGPCTYETCPPKCDGNTFFNC